MGQLWLKSARKELACVITRFMSIFVASEKILVKC